MITSAEGSKTAAVGSVWVHLPIHLDALVEILTTALRPFRETPARVLSLIHHWLRDHANATP
jgi:hypothetical protein